MGVALDVLTGITTCVEGSYVGPAVTRSTYFSAMMSTMERQERTKYADYLEFTEGWRQVRARGGIEYKSLDSVTWKVLDVTTLILTLAPKIKVFATVDRSPNWIRTT